MKTKLSWRQTVLCTQMPMSERLMLHNVISTVYIHYSCQKRKLYCTLVIAIFAVVVLTNTVSPCTLCCSSTTLVPQILVP